jgi:arylsulfatase A-like enzyme
MTADLFTTFLALAGAPCPADRAIDGIDLCPLLFDGDALAARTMFWRLREKRAARRGRWKLCMHGEVTELFDLDADLSETTDLQHAHPEVAASLRAELAAWEAAVARSV